MPVSYEELPGSPEINLERQGGSGMRHVKINWPDIPDFLDEIFPDPSLTGYLYGASMPGFPWMVATSVKFKPFVETKPRANVENWLGWHEFADVVVDYSVPRDDQQQQSGPLGDGTGPGGQDGSSGGQEITFLSHKVHSGGEYITWPDHNLLWEEAKVSGSFLDPDNRMAAATKTKISSTVLAADTTIKVFGFFLPIQLGLEILIKGTTDEICTVKFVTANADGTNTLSVTRAQKGTLAVGHAIGVEVRVYNPVATIASQQGAGGISASVVCPLLEHTIEWNYVTKPPWLAIRSLMGKVNHTKIAGIPAECGLFLGAECSRDITSQGRKAWKMSYKISEKNTGTDPLKPQGWNYFLRPSGEGAGTFQRLSKKTYLTSGAPIATTLTAAGMNATQKTVHATFMAAPWPQSGNFLIKIDSEVIQITGKLNATTWSCIRGVQGTTPAAHAGAAVVTQKGAGVYDVGDFRALFRII